MPLLHLLRQNPVIAAVKDNASLQLAIDSECQFISVLYGNICTISNIVKKIKNAGKYAFIHVDLLEGASNKEVVIQFLKLVNAAGQLEILPYLLHGTHGKMLVVVHFTEGAAVVAAPVGHLHDKAVRLTGRPVDLAFVAHGITLLPLYYATVSIV